MKFAVVAHRRSATNDALVAAAAGLGLQAEIVVPRRALTLLEPGDVALARLRYEKPDVVVLDLMLPGVDGWKLIEMARNEGIATPIVVVSARGTEHDRVHALEIGADDYLVKPFSMKELVARVRAAARRALRRE